MSIKRRYKECSRLLRNFVASVCLLSIPMGLFAQGGISVKGIVQDESGVSLPGVNVVVVGTTTGVITAADGRFTINVPNENAVLRFSFVGFDPQEVPVGNRRDFAVVLKESSQEIEEVVVIGYGTQRREAVTGSVASMRGETLAEVPATSFVESLQGRIAGVEMMSTNSKPGSEMQIRIRGQRSLTGNNDPLIVLDGIPFAGNLNDIDPSSIKGIDILKDASSTAIYGSRGANGVIIVTTKTGQRETPAKVSYSGYASFKKAIKFPMMTGDQFLELKQIAGVPYPQLSKDEKAGMNTDWQDLLLRTGYTTSHDINVTGGSKGGSYSIGGGYYRDQSVLPLQNYSRFALRANIDQEIGKYFRFGLITNNTYGVNNGNHVGMNITMSPLVDPYNDDGSLKTRASMNTTDADWYVNTRSTYEDLKDVWLNNDRTYASFNTVFAEVKAPWVEGLKFRVTAGLNFRLRNQGTYQGRGIGSTNPDNESTGTMDYRLMNNWTVENLLTYDRTFAGKHNVNVVALYSAEQTTNTRTYITARNIPNDQFQFWNLGMAEGKITVPPTVNASFPNAQQYTQSGLMSYMARAMYSYDGKYMLSVAFRSDGSSRLAEGHKWHTYPAVSVGWNLHRESFMSGISQINNLKLRVGYGQTSNQAVDPYSTLGTLTTFDYNFGPGDQSTGYYVSKLPNATLGWEYSKTWNFGLDFAVLNNRLSGTIEYYSQQTYDVLQDVNLPTTSGVNNYTANIGETQNKGFELTLNGTILKNLNGFTWDLGINFYINRNKLTKLASGSTQEVGNRWFVGYPINSLYDYKYDGIWQEGDAYMTDFQPGSKPGDIRVKYFGNYDANGKPTRSIGTSTNTPDSRNDDREIMSTEPDFQGGFNTRLAYKGFDLSIVGSFQSGGILIAEIFQTGPYLNNLNGRRGQIDIDYWTPTNTGARYPYPAGIREQEAPKYLNTATLYDAGYLKIRTITLGYNFSTKLTQSMGIDRLRVYVTAQNPFVMFSEFHKESGLDPEPNSAPTGAFRRFLQVSSNTPNTRNYLFGLNVTF